VIGSGGGAEPARMSQGAAMPVEPEKKLSDEELDQLARELFAEVRGETSEA